MSADQKERLAQKHDFIKENVDPFLSRMMVDMVKHKPQDVGGQGDWLAEWVAKEKIGANKKHRDIRELAAQHSNKRR